MEVDQKDVLSFLKKVFVKESNPGSLTVRVLRETYCKDRNIHQEYSKEQRRAFAMLVDSVFNDFAEAQEAANAVKFAIPNTVIAKRSYSQTSPDDDFRPTKRPKKHPMVQVELTEDDFQPAKLSKKLDEPSSTLSSDKAQSKKVTEQSVVNPINKSILKSALVEKDICEIPAPNSTKILSDEALQLKMSKTSQSLGSEDVELPKSEPLNSSTSASSEKSKLITENSNSVGKVNDSSSDNDSVAKSMNNCEPKPDSSSDDESPSLSTCHTQDSSGEPHREVRKPQSDKSHSDLSVAVSSDDEFLKTVTTAKKKSKYSTIVWDEDDEKPLVAISSVAKSKKLHKKSIGGHQSAKKSNSDIKSSKSDVIKVKKLKNTKPFVLDLNAVDDGFSSTDEEPLSGLVKKTAIAKENPRKTPEIDSVGTADESDSGAFKTKKEKVKKTQKTEKSSKNEGKDPNESKSKDVHLKEYVDPELTLLKQYIRAAGIHVMFMKVFKDCESVESKKQALTSLLVDAGLKGKPSMEKCKKLRVQRETKKEVDELDPSNILGNTEGRTRRATRSVHTVSTPSPRVVMPAKQETPSDSSAKKIFQRLKGIVDSEESD